MEVTAHLARVRISARKARLVVDAVRGKHRVGPVPYGTDASTIAEAGVPAVVFGPGNIDQAHTCDEWIELQEVETASEILFRLATAEN